MANMDCGTPTFGRSVVVVECPGCDELLLLVRNRLSIGHRVDCDHCGLSSTLSPPDSPGSAGTHWHLTAIRPDGRPNPA